MPRPGPLVPQATDEADSCERSRATMRGRRLWGVKDSEQARLLGGRARDSARGRSIAPAPPRGGTWLGWSSDVPIDRTSQAADGSNSAGTTQAIAAAGAASARAAGAPQRIRATPLILPGREAEGPGRDGARESGREASPKAVREPARETPPTPASPELRSQELRAQEARAQEARTQDGPPGASDALLDAAAMLRRLAVEVGELQFERYFLGQTRLAFSPECLEVTVTSGFLAQLLERRFGEALLKTTGARTLRFHVDRSVFGGARSDAGVPGGPHARAGEALAPRASDGRDSDARRAPRLPRASLDDFLVGQSNRLAFAAVKRLAEGSTPGAPVFLHGACGMGKTHLLQGCCGLFQRLHPRATIRYVTGEQFTNDYIQAIRQSKVEQFRKAYRGADMLCVDDVHFLANKDGTQGELLHTIDTLAMAGARIALASDEHPRNIGRVSERLVSRFLAGAVVQVESPDPALRRQLLRHLALNRGMHVNDDAVELLAQRSSRAVGSLGGFGGSVREMEGLLNQVDAVARLLGDAGALVDAALVRRSLGLSEAPRAGSEVEGVGPRRPIPVQAIVEHVCKSLHVDLGEFAGKGRHKRVVFARSVVAHLSRQMTTQSFPEIARAMGRTNHSTIITAQRRLQRQINTESEGFLNTDLAPSHPGRTLSELLSMLQRDIRCNTR